MNEIPGNSKQLSYSVNRRQFLQASLGAAGVAFSAPYISKAQGANSRIGIGFIGAGGRATTHMRVMSKLLEEGMPLHLAAVCDIYKPRREAKQKQFGIAKAYATHEELLDDPNVDVVCIATPDHHHAPQAIDAIRAGKDIYCEKPVSHWSQFEETKKLAEVARKSDRIFQLGTQAMSDPLWRQMKALVQGGLIGQPIQAETGYFRTGDWGERGMRVDDPDAKPGKDLNWNRFLGDARKRSFSVDRFFRWRLFEDYAGGPVTDLYPHSVTQIIDILGLGFPDRVTGLGSIDRYDYKLREVPDSFTVTAHYPENVTLIVSGTQGNDLQSQTRRGAGMCTPVIRGWDGSLVVSDNNREIYFIPTKGRGIEHGKPPQRFPIEGSEDTKEHFRNLLQCVQNRGQEECWSPMDLAFRTQTLLQMAMVSDQQSKIMNFDPDSCQMT